MCLMVRVGTYQSSDDSFSEKPAYASGFMCTIHALPLGAFPVPCSLFIKYAHACIVSVSHIRHGCLHMLVFSHIYTPSQYRTRCTQ